MNHLHGKLYELVGESSMCWSETPTGIFDTERAKLIADRFIVELEKLEKVVEAARNALDDMDRMFRTTQRLEDAIKELDGEK